MDTDAPDFLDVEQTKIYKILSGEAPIADALEVEDVLTEITKLDEEVEHFKLLKQKRVQPLDERIKSNTEKKDKLRSAILDFLTSVKKTSLDFPGIGKISRKAKNGSWSITDEDKLIEHLIKIGSINDVGEQIWSLDKKKLNKILDDLKENNNVVGAEKSKDDFTLQITFADGLKPSKSKESSAPIKPQPSSNIESSLPDGLQI